MIKLAFPHLTVVLAFAVVMIFLYGTMEYRLPRFANGDWNGYRAIAEAAPQLSQHTEAPLSYRLLGPYLIGLLWSDVDMGFRWATTAVLALTACAFFVFLRRRGITERGAAIAVGLWILNRYAFGFSAWDYFQIDDVLSFLLLLLAVDALAQRRWISFAATVVIGMLAREAALLLIPMAVAFLLEYRGMKRDTVGVAIAGVLAIGVYVGARFIVPTVAERSIVASFMSGMTKLAQPETVVRICVNAFLPFSLLPIIYFRHAQAFALAHRHLVVFVICVVVSTFLGADTERLMQPAMLVAYWWIADVIDREGSLMPSWWIPSLVAGGLLASQSHLSGRWPLPSRTATVVCSIVALIGVTMATLAARSRRSHENAPVTNA